MKPLFSNKRKVDRKWRNSRESSNPLKIRVFRFLDMSHGRKKPHFYVIFNTFAPDKCHI